jgi:hypothetical protein
MYQSISKKHVHTHGQLSNASSLLKEKLLYARCITSPSHINVVPCADPHVGSSFMWFPTVYPQSFQLETIHCPSYINVVPCAGSTCGIHFYVVSHSVSSKLSTRDYSLFATSGP